MTRGQRWLAAVLLAGTSAAAGAPVVRWTSDPADTNKVVVEVSGLSTAALQELRRAAWSTAQWQRLLPVFAEQGDLLVDVGLPPMLGAYSVQRDEVRFTPQFPLDAGLHYRATLYPQALPGKSGGGEEPATAVFRAPTRRAQKRAVVTRIYPSADVLPENLLKFYVHFSAPMSRGHIYDHIHLRNEAGRDIELPFLEIDEELWDPPMQRLTLFIDPGRIKRGVRPLEEIGPSLEAGQGYTLVIDAAWQDAAGLPLQAAFLKKFHVGPPEREPPDPARWKLQPPPAATRDALAIVFPKPLDHALAARVIQVTSGSGEALPGTVALEDQERRWMFIPASPWRRGPHQVVVQTTLEDLAGNNIGKPFEVDLFESVQRRIARSSVSLPFEIH